MLLYDLYKVMTALLWISLFDKEEKTSSLEVKFDELFRPPLIFFLILSYLTAGTLNIAILGLFLDEDTLFWVVY
jgi:hypothetical protein